MPRHTLTNQSKFFEKMLGEMTSNDYDGHIPLDGVTADELRRFLRVLYPRSVTSVPLPSSLAAW